MIRLTNYTSSTVQVGMHILKNFRQIPCEILPRCTKTTATNTQEPKSFAEIPQPPHVLPFFGTALHYKTGKYSVPNMRATLEEFYHKLGPLVREPHHGTTTVHVFEPDDLRTVYQNEGKIPHIVPLLESVERYRKERGFAPGVGNTNGEDWYRLRRAANAMMMKPHMVSKFLDLEQEVADDFIEDLMRRRDPISGMIPNFDLQLYKWSFETAGLNVYHKRFNSFPLDDPSSEPITMININQHMFQISTQMKFSLLPWYKWFATAKWREFVRLEDAFYLNIVQYFDEAVDALKSCIEEEDDPRFLFLRFMLRAEKVTRKDAHITAQSLFTDGLSTTVPTAGCLLYCLAAHPEKQEILRKEIIERIGGSKNPVTSDILQNMPYLKAFLKEVFRLYPLGPSNSRINTEDLVLSGYHIPKGTILMLHNMIHLKDPLYFNEPDQFLPERWLRDQDTKSSLISHPFLLLPFSHGPRMCLGRRFAEQELFLLTIKMLQNFHLEWKGKGTLGQKWQMLNVPDRPIEIAFHPTT